MLSACALGIATPLVSAKADGLLTPLWFGAYAGVQSGVDWTDVDARGAKSFTSDAATFGGHAGVNFQLFNFVAGIEGDINLDGTEGQTTIFPVAKAEYSADWTASVRGRLGVAFGPIMAYGTAGVAWKETTLVTATPSATISDSTKIDTGFVYGAGLEAYVLPKISLRLEALHYDFEAEKFDLDSGLKATLDPSSTVVRAAVTFHLN